MSRKLRISEYDHLLEKLASRFRSWAVKSLSFAGRAQLIKSVIGGTVNFWLSTFLLPKGCIKRIENLCSRFLWSGSIDEAKGAKISWDKVCLPKEEGGIGIRRFLDWNKTLCLKLIWSLFTEGKSLWAQWHTKHYLRDRSFWTVREAPTQTWTWRTLLHLRPLAARFLRCRVQNGKTAFFWFDSWSSLGPIIALQPHPGDLSQHVPLSARVCDSYDSQGWLFDYLEEYPMLHQALQSLTVPLPPDPDDYFVWRLHEGCSSVFSAAGTWDEIRVRRPEQPWMKTIWYKGAIPKLAFNMWVTHLDRLPTRHRLASWGVTSMATCYLCSEFDETRDHLFLHCQHSRRLWHLALQRIRQHAHTFVDWQALLRWANISSHHGPTLLRKLIVHVLIYHIWKQRNAVVHSNRPQSFLDLFSDIDKTIKSTILSKGSTRRWRNLMQLWLR